MQSIKTLRVKGEEKEKYTKPGKGREEEEEVVSIQVSEQRDRPPE